MLSEGSGECETWGGHRGWALDFRESDAWITG